MSPIIRHLGQVEYEPTWQSMMEFTRNRDEHTADEIWYLQHPPVFTQGLAGKAEHLLATGDIPVVQVDRGGQVTYHGPGQLVVYTLVDLKRLQSGVRKMVTALEDTVIGYLADLGIQAQNRDDAPGVYVGERKICSLGLKVRHGRTYHGLALNVDMDTEPFNRINPCGYAGLEIVQLADLDGPTDIEQVIAGLHPHLLKQLGF